MMDGGERDNDPRRERVGDVIKRVGIPTRYRGINMRSRHEARWAAFFDELHWTWAYEPIDLAGYIPDFLLDVEAGHLLVEVKPQLDDMAIAQSKIECSGWEREALVVVDAATPLIGTILEWEDGEPIWSDATLFECLSCDFSSVRSVERSWRCRRCGAAGGNGHVGEFRQRSAWGHAGNRVQWRKPE
jgi:hypothetical protein